MWDAQSQVLAECHETALPNSLNSLLPATVTSKLGGCFVVLISLGHQNFRMFLP